ncbi:chondroitin sulfate proteoglycan 4 [Pangasianodon hypophthalmus]|uniref:chondroitin sulfate proteoglycan 4 n=1 Tax=Pangasianodon hypophthalmus TaxID=310915 RepID=UPI0023077FB9|nr:chondroitin sulfate proteoglycan 4 [Pangasianodon hypophthalmus]
MADKMRTLLSFGLLLLLFVGVTRGASFYGDGFVQLKVKDSTPLNTLHIRFRTSSQRGVLFLAAGQTDYLLLELSSGRLQAKLDLGSGERILHSDKGNPLNDLAWHTVDLIHDRFNVNLTVDKHFQTSQRLPGLQQELDINDGLYIGGTGGLDKVYLPTDLTGFRGCLDEVLFNQHNLLSSLRPYSGLKNVYEVSLGCSPQFFANEEEAISFFSSRAYVSLPPWPAQQEWTLECSVHTSAQEGIIMYNSAREGGFVAMEIHDGLLVAVVGRDGLRTELRSLTFISDKKWHYVKLYFTAKSLQLTIDGETVKSSIKFRSKTLHLKGFLFLGGVDDGTRSEVRKVGLSSVAGKRIKGGSFKGCFRDIKVNGILTGLPNALVTKDISVGCEPEKEPQISTTLSPTPVSKIFEFVTQLPSIDMSTLANGLVAGHGQNFLQLRNLVVPEGSRASLESKHIKVNLDFKKLGIRQSQIMFRIEEQPVHGQLRFDVDQEQEENTFSMLDLWHGRVMYIHGGSEDPHDYFMFSVFSSSKKVTPSYLKGEKSYRFNVTVTPTNDAPELSLPEGNLFVLLENSRKRLTTDVLKATDIDSSSTDLVYSVLGNLNADAGFLETEDNPGQAVTSFPHSALEAGKINYAHTGVRNSRIVLRVSDGEKISNTVVLRIMAVKLEYSVTNNTGVEVTQGEMALINTTQLAIQTNAVRQVVDIRYDVVEPPRFGELQKLHSNGEWKFTNSFSQRLLEKNRLRYLSTFKDIQSANLTDHFKCKITIAAKATEELVFNIKTKWINYIVERNEVLEMDKIRRVAIDSEHLYATPQGVALTEDEIYFKLLSSTKKGLILLNNEKLGTYSTFSQMNITNMEVEYQLIDRPYENTSDSFEFQVFSKHAYSTSHVFRINIRADINSIYIKNSGLSVFEGESKLITNNELFAETLSTKEIYYTVTEIPKHGKLARINLSNSTKDYDNLVSFTNQDIIEERLMYVHDDSETTHDQFRFIASTSPLAKSVNEEEVGSKDGVFNISIQLVNDEKPVRIEDKVFHVVKNGQRLLTLDDLCYHDADSDFSDGQLVYTRRGIPIGDLVLVNDTSHKLYQFRQEDLEQKRVLFVHRGMNSGRFVLFVSDGKHYISSLLDISAEEPYLKVTNNTGLLVQKGQAGTFSTANFSVITNMDIREDSEIAFKINDAPKHGALFLKDKQIDSFTQFELKNALLSYRHDGSKNLDEFFSVIVEAKGLHVEARINVKVYLESHQKPPVMLNNKILVVDEGKPVKIERSKLEVTHEANLPNEIIFTVKVAPAYGYLRSFVNNKKQFKGTEQDPLITFTQQDINTGNIQYVQVMPDQVNDSFVLEASNGVAELSGIIMSVDIIPLYIPVEVSNITLKEGASKALTENIIQVTSQHFSGVHFVYYVSEGPMHGHIENSRFPGTPTTYFTRKQVEQEFIYYVHDNSETLQDYFTIIANATDLRKHSIPRTVHIQVTPVNDEPPVITANKVLRVWVSSMTEITPEDLNAEDDDTAPEQLHYLTTQPSNGHLALKSAPAKPVMNFTQAHIDQGQLLFVHSGATAGGFNFQVNDGVNFAPRQIFSVTARTLVLHMERSGPLKVFPGASSSISKEVFKAATNDNEDNSNRTIVFTIVNPPKFGKLVTVQADNSMTEISSFTQKMVDEGKVAYEQNVDSVGWAALDKFTFTASSPPASLEAQTFDIDISYENSGPERNSLLLKNTGAVVIEGDKVIIDRTLLDASNLLTKQPESRRNLYDVWYQVKSLPQHGVIIVGERNLTKEKPYFSQFILNKYGITYQHDNSETMQDCFVFDAFLNLKSKPAQRPEDDREVLEETFNITVTPVNDQPPVLKTKAPSLKVVQGDTVALGPSNLNVEDLDNSPDDVQYSVISRPSNGFLSLVGSLNVSVDTFSQAQINNGEVFFVQDGSPASGAFYFSVTDGHHRPVYKLFNIEVLKIAISIVNQTDVILEQGQTSVLLNQSHLAAVTNGKNTTVQYKISALPKYGKLLLDNVEVTAFNQNDLQAHRLSYHMVNLASSYDNFEFTAFTSEANLTDQMVNITVKPLIRYAEGVKFSNEIRVKLKADFLNVSELALISGSNPLFEILSPPMYGKILKNGKGKKAEPTKTFFFSELQQEKLVIELKANLTEVQEVNDSLRFVLKAGNLQPANGEFVFSIVPHDPALITTTVVSLYTSSTASPSQTTVMNFPLISKSPSIQPSAQVTKAVPKFKGRNRWGNSNRSDSHATTMLKPTHSQEVVPMRNQPVRVESVSQSSSSSNPMLIILPLLALLLVVIVVILVLLLRRNQQKKKKHLNGASAPKASSDRRHFEGHPERTAVVPLVTVTPLSPSNPGSPALTRLQTGNPAYGQSMTLYSFGDMDLEATQFCRTTNPTLQHNQYWV